MIEILDSIPVTFDSENVLKLLRVRHRTDSIVRMVSELIEQAAPVVRPKATYAVSLVSGRQDGTFEVDGVEFRSRVLSKNLEDVNRIFPYVATCGVEIDAIKMHSGDLLRSYCLDILKALALMAAGTALEKHLTARYQLGRITHMNPGELQDWPVTQQKALFSVLGDVEGTIGVRLTEGMVMIPTKSRSGLYFPNDADFETCRLCPVKRCPGRRARYEPEAINEY
jgi:hypothetical protein